MYILVNSKLVPIEKARISPFDHGYLYGIGLFETIRVYNRHPFLLDDHIERLNEGLRRIGIAEKRPSKAWQNQINQLLEANGYDDAYIRINVSAGVGGLGLTAEKYNHPTTIVFSKPLPADKTFPEKTAVFLKTRRNSPETSIRLKSHHFLNNVMAKREIGDDARREGIFLNEQGYIAEGIVSNLFWVKDGVIYTPSLETGILNGITRQFICALLKKKRIEVKEGLFTPDHLYEADEAFMANSIQEIVPFCAVDDNRNFPGNRGELTRLLLKDYKKYRTKLFSRNQL